MSVTAEARAEAARLIAHFEAAGAERVETDILQPAETLLDLYGEDIRARAYVTSDPLRGEQMLRPDFTVPLVLMHVARGGGGARYTYAGEVFRRQEVERDRPSEYLQVGYESFAGETPEAEDAEVFARIAEPLAPLGLRAATGDIGVLRSAVEGLATTPARKAALLRHLWRPRRFRALVDRFARPPAPSAQRARVLEAHDPLDGTPPWIGVRAPAEVRERVAALRDDAAAPPLAASEVALMDALLGVRETAPNALAALRDIAVDLRALTPALDRLERRLEALGARGFDPETLDFEASYGRTALEYYDGFVFGLHAPTRPDLPPVAAGGRYDALTRVLGRGRALPAVGGAIRPEVALLLGGGR
jgi:ATP phosphoribosyltransferase regulatory subunit